MRRPSTSRLAGGIGLTVGLSMALAANLTYAIPRGPVVVGLGLTVPIVLFFVLWVRFTFIVIGMWRTLLREASMFAVAGPAVAISYVHTYELVRVAEPGWWILAVVAPLSSDGVAGISTMALHWSGHTPARKASRPTVEPAPKSVGVKTPTPVSASAPPPNLAERGHQRTAMVAWLESRPPVRATDEVAALTQKFSCSVSTAKRVRREAGRVAS